MEKVVINLTMIYYYVYIELELDVEDEWRMRGRRGGRTNDLILTLCILEQYNQF